MTPHPCTTVVATGVVSAWTMDAMEMELGDSEEGANSLSLPPLANPDEEDMFTLRALGKD